MKIHEIYPSDSNYRKIGGCTTWKYESINLSILLLALASVLSKYLLKYCCNPDTRVFKNKNLKPTFSKPGPGSQSLFAFKSLIELHCVLC